MSRSRRRLTVILDCQMDMTPEDIAKHWRAHRYAVIPGFVTAQEIEQLRRICDHVLEQAIEEDPRRAAARNIAYLTEQTYFQSREDDLLKLLEFIADDRIVSILSHMAGEMPLFHNTQYFYNPAESHDGEWHRDTQFLAPDEAVERQRMKQHTGVHFQIAFLPDRQLEYVPGSEQRWDTPEELSIRKGDHPTGPEIPGRTTIDLAPGDACLFHAWGIHRGTYRSDVPRRTLDIIYGRGRVCDYAPPPPIVAVDWEACALYKEAFDAFLDPEFSVFLIASIAVRSLAVRPMANKWASCSTAGNLNFNAELLGMDRAVGDYVIVHELLHFSVPHHGKLWKNLMRAHLGDYGKLDKQLKRLAYRADS